MIYCGRWYSVENKKKGKNHKKNPWWIPWDKTPTGKNASPTFVKKGHAPIALHVSPNETPPASALHDITGFWSLLIIFDTTALYLYPSLSLSLSSLLPRLYHRSPHVQILELLQLRFSLTISRFLRSNRRWFASRLRVDLRADTVENLRASHFFWVGVAVVPSWIRDGAMSPGSVIRLAFVDRCCCQRKRWWRRSGLQVSLALFYFLIINCLTRS